MKKKWMGFFVAAMLIVSQAMCVSASRVTTPVTAGASTPEDQIDEVVDYLETL